MHGQNVQRGGAMKGGITHKTLLVQEITKKDTFVYYGKRTGITDCED